MTRLRKAFPLLLLLTPMTLFAQDSAPVPATPRPQRSLYWGPQFLSAQDSMEFAIFKERCARKDDTSHVSIFTDDHRLVWHEGHHGGFWLVSRGDGRTLSNFMAAEPAALRFPFGMPPAPFGKRCMMVVRDEPTGLINRDEWYFEAP